MGYATEAAKAVIEYGLRVLRFHKIRVYHAAENPASGRTIEKLGFRLVGEEVDAFFKEDKWHHLRHYELLAKTLSDVP
jgi:RimJ/RimL family protein N-acetyltransferase